MRILSLKSTYYVSIFFTLAAFSNWACGGKNPNTSNTGEDILISHEATMPQQNKDLAYADTIYVPIYSDIYVTSNNPRSLLSATLSIRNTSLSDSLYISSIEYYDTQGRLVRDYLENPIRLNPMESIDYVVEKEDEAGGTGANFILTLSANRKSMRPIIQAVMIGNDGNKGFAFVTEGYSISSD